MWPNSLASQDCPIIIDFTLIKYQKYEQENELLNCLIIGCVNMRVTLDILLSDISSPIHTNLE